MREIYAVVRNKIQLKRQHIVLLLLVSFALVVLTFAALVLAALQSVAETTNKLDENRSWQAVLGALTTFGSQMASTMNDYSMWDEAARSIYGSNGKAWAIDNFGLDTETSEIFDISYLLDSDGEILLGFRHGQFFSQLPSSFLAPVFDKMMQQVRAAGSGDEAEVVGFVRTPEGPALVAIATVRAASGGVAVPADRLQRLVFIKFLDQNKIAGIAQTYGIAGLHLIGPEAVTQAVAPITDPEGQIIAGLAWTAQLPGDISYRQVQPYVLLAVAIVGAFVVLLVLAGAFVIGRLRDDEIAARRMALTDRLSGLGNRIAFSCGLRDLIAEARVASRDVVLLYLDMDGFKEVNDVYGHGTGDRLIQNVATGLLRLLPPGGVLSRLGGDEFAIALSVETGAEPALHVQEAVLDFFSEPAAIDDLVVVVGVSIGVALSERGSVDADELLRRADIAMYKAKSEGRGRAMSYHPAMDVALAERNAMELALRSGLQKSEFFVVYQPVVDARSRRIVGLEALLRWNSPQLGMVPPDVFIPLAETSGLIDRLGVFVLEEALRVAARWPWIAMSVNVSPAQFRHPFFISNISRLLEKSGFDASSVTLEVTEGYFIHNPDHARDMIKALTGLGVRVALDDFGAGFSSIGYLRQFGFDRLKLDRSMVEGMQETQRGRDMLQATLALAAALDIPVTAEGIETDEQAHFLSQCGCDQLQGYYFARPLPEADLPAVLSFEQADRQTAISA